MDQAPIRGSSFGKRQEEIAQTVSFIDKYLMRLDIPFDGSIVVLVVQLFLCYRIWKLRKRDWYSVIIALISVPQLIGGVNVHFNKYFDVIRQLEVDQIYAYPPIDLTLRRSGRRRFDCCDNDISISTFKNATLDLNLGPNESSLDHNPFQSRSVANKIVRLVVQSNSLTSGVAVTSVIFLVVAQAANYFIAS
ncbi:hypothetical protein M378DRAFT_15996 [Amanita muscaria Koide BX008]|uniref:Uncharacterized protein n=1 Tax=Amanita muscaria (strain Koide BX008) TaxID=946122 RepID=A0A0C2WNH0_AMAMK|nr:hypothetical protein M378DRAFT_15996 [Amanita muscaria Koide BX008]